MKSKRQAFSPSNHSMKIIEACAKDLSPDDPSLSEWHQSYASNQKTRIALDLDIVEEKIPVGGRILECGSIPLLMTMALSKCGYHVTGCDIAPQRYSSAIQSTGLDVIRCNIETERLPFTDEVFDAVVFNELFEHLRINPVFTLSEVRRVIKPDGTLILTTPNLKSLGGMINYLFRDRNFSSSGNLYEEYQKLETLGHMGHVREYTRTEIIGFLQNLDFVIKEVICRGRYHVNLAQIMIRLIPALSPFITYIAVKPPNQEV